MGEVQVDHPEKLDRAGQAEQQLATRVAEQGRTSADDVRAGAEAMSGNDWEGRLGRELAAGETEWGKKLDHVRKSLDATGGNLVKTAKNFRTTEQENTDWLKAKQPAVLPDFI